MIVQLYSVRAEEPKLKEAHCRTYNLQMTTIVPCTAVGHLDPILHCRDGGMERINEVHNLA